MKKYKGYNACNIPLCTLVLHTHDLSVLASSYTYVISSRPMFHFVDGADMYKGQQRTRTIDVYVDGNLATTWTTSGSSDDFETVPLPPSIVGQPAGTIELVGLLSDSEWLSIEEVRNLVILHRKIGGGGGGCQACDGGGVAALSLRKTRTRALFVIAVSCAWRPFS